MINPETASVEWSSFKRVLWWVYSKTHVREYQHLETKTTITANHPLHLWLFKVILDLTQTSCQNSFFLATYVKTQSVRIPRHSCKKSQDFAFLWFKTSRRISKLNPASQKGFHKTLKGFAR